MAYPLCPGKPAELSATDPLTLYAKDDSFPESVILCFQPPVYERTQTTYEGYREDPGHPRYSLYVLSEPAGGRVGAVGDLGIGGPATARVVEELVARGTETFVIVGHAASLQREIDAGDAVVAERALRDEGTSYHYLDPERAVDASAELTERLAEATEQSGETVRVGTTWTTDAIFRTTVPEVEKRADEGVLTIDMEAATPFAVSTYRNVRAAAGFVVSDYVGPGEWEGRVGETWPHLERLFDRAVDVLADE